jgi:hypothetical protein
MNNLDSGSNYTGRSAERKCGLRASMRDKSTITCRCGAQILLVPDLKEMNTSLEAHVNEHKKKDKISDVEAEVILEDLIAQLFRKI